jgi:hypothetical protein
MVPGKATGVPEYGVGPVVGVGAGVVVVGFATIVVSLSNPPGAVDMYFTGLSTI